MILLTVFATQETTSTACFKMQSTLLLFMPSALILQGPVVIGTFGFEKTLFKTLKLRSHIVLKNTSRDKVWSLIT